MPVCVQKPDTCNINDVCYQQRDTHPVNICLVCDASRSVTDWSASTEPQCQPTTPTTTTGEPVTSSPESVEFNSRTIIIVAGSVAGLLLLIIVVVSVVIVVRKRRLAHTRFRSTLSQSDEDSQFEHIFNGSFGIRTDKSLTFYNPSPSDYYYDNNAAA
jgi:hypothetical protein